MSNGKTGWQLHNGAADSCAMDQSPGTTPMPAAGQSPLWQYKGIYLQTGQRAGQWSDVVSIPVAR